MDWFLVFVGWLGGIPSGLFVNWLFHKYLRWRRSKGDYFASTFSGGMWQFEGRISHTGSIEDVVRQLTKKSSKEL